MNIAPPLQLPRPFGPYELVRELASGGMGRVYLARARSVAGFEKIVALKMIHRHLSADPEFTRLLVEEANLTGQLTHKNIVQVIDFAQVDDTRYIAMEFVDGFDLSKLAALLRAAQKQLSARVAAFIVREVCDALEYAHRKVGSDGRPLRIVHRDVSPPNILVSIAGEVKITDFGVAKAASRIQENDSVKGKYAYMPPEQARGQMVDHRADVFAAGCVLYELVTNTPVYPDTSLPLLLDRVSNGQFRPVDQIKPDLPRVLVDVIHRALMKNPGDRFPSARAMGDALNAFLYTLPPNPETELSRLLSDLSDARRTSSPPIASLSLMDDESDEPTQIESMAVVREKMAKPTFPPAAKTVAKVSAKPSNPPPSANSPFQDEPTRSVRMPDARKSLPATPPPAQTSAAVPGADDDAPTASYNAARTRNLIASMQPAKPPPSNPAPTPNTVPPTLETPFQPPRHAPQQAVALSPVTAPSTAPTPAPPPWAPTPPTTPAPTPAAAPSLAQTTAAATREVPSVPPTSSGETTPPVSSAPSEVAPSIPPEEPSLVMQRPHESELIEPVGWFSSPGQKILFILSAMFATCGVLTLLAVLFVAK